MKNKIIVIISFLLLTSFLNANEREINVKKEFLKENKSSIKFNINKEYDLFSETKNKNNDTDYLLFKTGFILTVSGGTALLTGGFFIGFSYLAAWYAIWDFIDTPEFTVKNWAKVWQIIFAYPGYTYTSTAIFLLLSGIIIGSIGLATTTCGIVFLIYSIYQYKKRGEKPSLIKRKNYSLEPSRENFGICLRF